MTVENAVQAWATIGLLWLAIGGLVTGLSVQGSRRDRIEVTPVAARWTIAAPLWPIAAVAGAAWCLWKLIALALERQR